jgi:uncharacterized protein (UPF0335 family)
VDLRTDTTELAFANPQRASRPLRTRTTVASRKPAEENIMSDETLDDGAQRKLSAYVKRIEKLEEEKKTIADDVASIYAEAKSYGFDVKIMRNVVKLRKLDKDDRTEFLAVLDVYMHALGMLADTPLGEAAIDRLRKSGSKRKERDATIQ